MDRTTSVIFDLGGVVVRWEPDVFPAEFHPDPDVQEKVRSGLLRHSDWRDLDRGTLTREEALHRAATRTGLPVPTLADFVAYVQGAIVADPETVDLLYRVRASGRGLYCLSNMHHAVIDHLERTYDFWEVFDGMVISCREQLVKPDPAIYRRLLDRYGLDAATTVFVDDAPENVHAAERVGLQTVRFESPRQCARELGLTDQDASDA